MVEFSHAGWLYQLFNWGSSSDESAGIHVFLALKWARKGADMCRLGPNIAAFCEQEEGGRASQKDPISNS